MDEHTTPSKAQQTVIFSVSAPATLLAEVDRVARAADLTRAQYIRSALRRMLATEKGSLEPMVA